ncbi:hypothetical protein ACRB68_51510 [Actinomadura sp. RB68]|uniref:HTH tetR-type domain-containing protein n=2 Tax=Actinomadura macrotermitis TaxID=2585200 RepID=A0A7K0C2K0_9ACTN|nr:hypothetical protein [Actinomadura macrotermitis]
MEIFGTTGYRTATVESVCARAELTKRYFYESFSSSEDLLLAVYAHTDEKLRKTVETAVASAGPDPHDIIRTALTELFSALQADHRLARLLFVEILGVSPAVDAAYQRTSLAWGDTIAALLAGWDPPGVRRDLLATAILGAVIGAAVRWSLEEYADPMEDIVQALRTLFAAALSA